MKKAFQQRFAYRVNFFVSSIGNFLWIFIQVSVWQALFEHNATVEGISLTDMISFVILNLFITSLSRTNLGVRLGERINSGQIVNDFIKPINIKYFLFSEDFGGKLFNLIFTVIPTVTIASYFWGFSLPVLNINLILFLITVINGLIISYNLSFIFGLFAFWLKDSWYVDWYLRALTKLFGGTLVPLWFYPDLLYKISKVLPLRLIVFEPINIYLDKISYQQAVDVIYQQLIWIVVLLVIEKLVWKLAQKKITIFGG